MKYAPTATRATGAIVAAGFGISVAVNWPGHLSYDSVVQLDEGRLGQYGGWHPPVMSWLLGIADRVVTGTGLFVLFDAILLFAALGSLVFLGRRDSWTATLLTLGFVLTPQFLLYPGIVWKDVLFAASACLGFVILAHAALRWRNSRARVGLVLGASLFLTLAALARQNGAVVLPVAACAIGWIALLHGASRFKAIAWAAMWLGVVLGIFIVSALALNSRWTRASGPLGQMRLLATYDLAGALATDPHLPLPLLKRDDPLLEHLMRTEATRLYTPERNDTLVNSADLQRALNRADDRLIPAEWRAFVERDPGLYLGLRWTAFRWVFFTPDLAACRPVFVGVSGPPDLMRGLAIEPRMDVRDAWLSRYAWAFAGTPVWSHATFATISLLAAGLLLLRRRPEDIAVLGLVLAGLLFAASFFVISIACDYRYLYFTDLAGILSALYLALNVSDWLSVIRRSRSGTRSDD